MLEDVLLLMSHVTGLGLGLWLGGRLSRQRPDLLQWFWGL